MNRDSVFSSNPSSKIAIGVFSPKDIVNYEPDSIQEHYLKLRADVYVKESGFLDESSIRPDGTELDKDDERSAHFIALENRLGRAAVVGCMRLPQKTAENMKRLPIEEFFPAVFKNEAPEKSIEVSRLIARHDNAKIQDMVKRLVIANGLAYTTRNNLGPVYAVVEEPLKVNLEQMGVPLEVIAGPDYIDKYKTVNVGIRVDQLEFERRLGKKALNSFLIRPGDFNYFGEVGSE